MLILLQLIIKLTKNIECCLCISYILQISSTLLRKYFHCFFRSNESHCNQRCMRLRSKSSGRRCIDTKRSGRYKEWEEMVHVCPWRRYLWYQIFSVQRCRALFPDHWNWACIPYRRSLVPAQKWDLAEIWL